MNVIDMTSLQGLMDMRNTLDRYAAPAVVEWHFAGVHSRWTRRALAFAGFGYPSTRDSNAMGNWCPAYTISTSFAGITTDNEHESRLRRKPTQVEDEESRCTASGKFQANGVAVVEKSGAIPIYGVDRPFFHVDLVDAVDAAVRDARKRDEDWVTDPRSVSTNGNGMV